MRKIVAAIAVSVALATGIPAWAQGQTAATVDGQPITRQALTEYLMERFGYLTLQELINEMLIGREAKRKGIVVTDADVSAEIAKFRQENGLEQDQAFAAYLWSQQPASNEPSLRRTMRIRLLVQKALGPRVQLTDQEVSDFYQKNQKSYILPDRVRLRRMMLENDQTLKEMTDRLAKGEKFQDLAKTAANKDYPSFKDEGGLFFEGPPEQMGPPLMPVDFAKAVSSLKEGQVSPPVRAGGVIFLLQVDKRLQQRQVPFEEARESIRQELFNDRLYNKVWPQFLNDATKAAKIQILLKLPAPPELVIRTPPKQPSAGS